MRWLQICGTWLVGGLAAWAAEVPATLFLSWEGDPRTTMTAQWMRGPGLGQHPEPGKPETIQWRKAGTSEWNNLVTKTDAFPDPKLWRVRQIKESRMQSKKAVFPHPTKVKASAWLLVKGRWEGLEPGQEYEFRTGESPVWKFRTAPAQLEPGLTFAAGGDSDVSEEAEEIFGAAAVQNPLFIHVGGDLAYSDGHDVPQEMAFWRMYHRAAQTKEGRLIPFVAGIGNHDVQGGYWKPGKSFEQMKELAPFYYALFGGLYRTEDPVALDFGDYLSLLMLDTGHVTPMDRQTGWLEKNLELRKGVPWLFASWHIAAYPSARGWNSQPMSGYARGNWIPLIEKSRAAGVFNHHDHDLQRVETEGKAGRKIMVFGNGAIGIDLRRPRCEESARLAKARAMENHIYVVSLAEDKATVTAIGIGGKELDRTEIRRP
ncbi:MAG: hypothetical protein RLZZ112_655 [Verrucomicrobiota bacterium]